MTHLTAKINKNLRGSIKFLFFSPLREQPTLISLSSFHHLRVDFESVEDIVEGSSLLPRLQAFRPESVEAPVQHVINHLETLLAHEFFFEPIPQLKNTNFKK